MKKFFVPLFFFLLFGCTEDFESEKAAYAQKNVLCMLKDGHCKNISESVCDEVGEPVTSFNKSGCIQDEVSSSSNGPSISSSSKTGSSSSGNPANTSSSSSNPVIGSSSSVDGSSSSSVDIGSSSSLAPPKFKEECSPFPYYYVSTEKKEYIKNLASLEGDADGCVITYNVATNASIAGDSISFSSASSTPQTFNIAVSAMCGTEKISKSDGCKIEVVVADNYQDSVFCNGNDKPANLTISGTTVFEYRCNESKTDYYISCRNPSDAEYTLSVKGYPDANSEWGGANLPSIEPIEINESLFHYPERVLVTVTGGGTYTCGSW